MTYPFEMTLHDLIEKLTALEEKHGNIFVETLFEGCYGGMNITYVPAKAPRIRGGYEVEEGEVEHILIGERVY